MPFPLLSIFGIKYNSLLEYRSSLAFPCLESICQEVGAFQWVGLKYDRAACQIAAKKMYCYFSKHVAPNHAIQAQFPICARSICTGTSPDVTVQLSVIPSWLIGHHPLHKNLARFVCFFFLRYSHQQTQNVFCSYFHKWLWRKMKINGGFLASKEATGNKPSKLDQLQILPLQ